MSSGKSDNFYDLETQDKESIRTIAQLYGKILDDPSWSSCISEEGKHMWKVIRNLAATRKSMFVIESLVGTDGMSFGELKKKTGMDSNDINHALISLKENGLIIQNEGSKKYEVTVYCIALLATFTRLNNALEWLNESNKHVKCPKEDDCLIEDDNFAQPNENVPVSEKKIKLRVATPT
jgi:transcription initiation factor IIE alpha subunit